MGRAWGQNLRACENVEVVGWVDLRPDAATQAAEELGLRGVYTGPDLEKAIAA
jgi:predicted dehydrogenase